jgi:hypothetical protein
VVLVLGRRHLRLDAAEQQVDLDQREEAMAITVGDEV